VGAADDLVDDILALFDLADDDRLKDAEATQALGQLGLIFGRDVVRIPGIGRNALGSRKNWLLLTGCPCGKSVLTYHIFNRAQVDSMSKPITIAVGVVNARLINATPEVKALVSKALSYVVEGYEFTHAYQTGSWSGRSSFYEATSGLFPAGFVHLIHGELVSKGHKVQIVRKPVPQPLGPADPTVDEFGNDDPRYDFQRKALLQVEKHHRGIIQVATGGGKSKIAKLIAARYRRMTMFITTRGILMYQMKAGFERADLNVGVVGDGIWAPVKGVNVGMVQTLVAQLKEPTLDEELRGVIKQIERRELNVERSAMQALAQQRFDDKTKVRERMIKLLGLVEVVIGEEAHEAGGNSYFEILRWCKNAKIRVALTATPFMRDVAEDNMRLMAAFGPVLIKVSEQLLINRGILATPKFLFHESKPHEKLRKTSPWQRAYQLGIIENPHLEADIVRHARQAKSYNLPVLTLVVRKQHGANLLKAMTKAGLKATFLQGEDDQEARHDALVKLGNGSLDVIIGTTILDVGVDVPAIGLVQLAGGMKAQVALRQRVGRGLRAKKGVPNYAFVIDYSVELNTALREHSRTRRAIIEMTPGFRENIVPKGADLPWSLFVVPKAA
jgi:superfamily II DNA or RNA helicase